MIAINMKNLGMTVRQISQMIQYSEETVRGWLAEQKDVSKKAEIKE